MSVRRRLPPRRPTRASRRPSYHASLFPIGLSNPPPPGGKTPGGADALAELARGGVNLLRTGIPNWNGELLQGQIANERARLDAAAAHGLHCWLWLGELANLPASSPSTNEQLLTKVVNGLKNHPALFAYKGIDEPRNQIRGADWILPACLVRAYSMLKTPIP